MNAKREVRAERRLYKAGVDLHFFERLHSGRIAVARNMVFEEIDEDDFVGEGAIFLPIDAAQQLIDELWNCGLRPSEGTGSAGSLAATERHLQDMKAIAIGALEKIGVKAK